MALLPKAVVMQAALEWAASDMDTALRICGREFSEYDESVAAPTPIAYGKRSYSRMLTILRSQYQARHDANVKTAENAATSQPPPGRPERRGARRSSSYGRDPPS